MTITFDQFFEWAQHIDATGMNPYIPFPNLNRALRFSDGGNRVNFGYMKDGNSFRNEVTLIRAHTQVLVYSASNPSDRQLYKGSDPFCFGDAENQVIWYEKVGLTGSDYEFFRDLLGPYSAKMAGEVVDEEIPMPRPDYLTFGDFMNFCGCARRDWYGVYQPFSMSPNCLHIYDNLTQVNFSLKENEYLTVKVAFINTSFDSVKVCRVENGVVDYDNGLEYNVNQPFAFGNHEDQVTWWKNVGLTGAEYEWFRDMLGGFRRGDKII